MAGDYYVHPTADVSPLAAVGPGTKIWNQAQVREQAVLGAGCVIGKDVYIDRGVTIGSRVKIQNTVSVYQGVTIEDDVFVGPSATFTNDMYPRADNADWRVTPTLIRRGASIGANATIICGVTIGEKAMVGAGAVVTRDVPPYALVVGNPARVLRWLGTSGNSRMLPVMLIGFGNMGANHARILSALTDEFELRLIADCDQERRAVALARYPAVRVVADWHDGLDEVEAVVVATPASTHFSIASEALQLGKHCLLEKPCALSLSNSIQLFDLAVSHGRLLQVGHSERFNPAVETLLQLLQNEKIVAVSAERLGLATRKNETDVVFDLAIHDLEIMQALIGQPATRVAAQGVCRDGSYEQVQALIEYAGGVVASLTASRLTPRRCRVITVTTNQAVFVADCLTSTITVYRADAECKLGGQHCASTQSWQLGIGADALTKQARAFYAGIRSGQRSVSSETVNPAIAIAEMIVQQLVTRT